MIRRGLYALTGLLFALGVWQAGGGVYIHAKALLAQVLIKQAWAEVQARGGAMPPWPWADTSPVARLTVPSLDIDQIVLAGASGRTLAFGPGHMDGTPKPGAPGISVVSGHRDTHFRFLKELKAGDTLQITTPDRTILAYRVTDIRVVNSETVRIETDGDTPRLALVTCYPFDTIETGGPLRYVVMAEAAPLATAESTANR